MSNQRLTPKAVSGFAAGVLFFLALIIYLPTLDNRFVYDDRTLIEHNPLLTRLSSIPSLFVTQLWSGKGSSQSADSTQDEDTYNFDRRYRPMLMASYSLNYAVDGFNPLGYHLVNVVFHAAVTAVFYLVALELGWSQSGAFVSSVLFAVHPLHSEAVAWVAGRPEMMMAMGVLGALWCAMRGRQIAAVLSFLFALFCKEQAVVLPALILLADVCRQRSTAMQTTAWPAMLQRYGYYVVILIGFLALRTTVLRGFQPARYPFFSNPLEHMTGVVWLMNVLKMAGHYLWLSIWPAALSVDYSYNALPLATTVQDPGVLWAAVAWGSLLWLGIWGWGRDRRTTFAVGLTMLTFLPAANLLVPVGTPFAERLFYLPLSGLCLLAGLLWEQIMPTAAGRQFRTWIILGVALGLLLAARTVVRLQDWKTTETLFRSAVEVVPGNAGAHFLLGSELMRKGTKPALEEGITEFERALAIYPAFAREDGIFAYNLGTALVHVGRYEEARTFLEFAVTKHPRWSMPYHYLGLAYMKLDQSEKAVDAWGTALKLDPSDMQVRWWLSPLRSDSARK